MAEIPGYGERFAFGDPTEALPDWRAEEAGVDPDDGSEDREGDDDDSADDDAPLTDGERRALVSQLGFDPAEMGD